MGSGSSVSKDTKDNKKEYSKRLSQDNISHQYSHTHHSHAHHAAMPTKFVSLDKMAPSRNKENYFKSIHDVSSSHCSDNVTSQLELGSPIRKTNAIAMDPKIQVSVNV